MSSFNVTREHSVIASDINKLQNIIAQEEIAHDLAVNTGDFEEMSVIKIRLASLRAALGQRRNDESAIRTEISEAKQAHKSVNELSKG